VEDEEIRLTVTRVSPHRRGSDDRNACKWCNFWGIRTDVNGAVRVFDNNEVTTDNASVGVGIKFATCEFRRIL
jgi:hypothetical protein